MKAALGYWAREMRKAGFDMYSHPDEIERDLRNRLNALTEGGRLLVNKMSPDQKSCSAETPGFRARCRGQELQDARGGSCPC